MSQERGFFEELVVLINVFRVSASFDFLKTLLPCLPQEFMSHVTVLLCVTGNISSHIFTTRTYLPPRRVKKIPRTA
jgi:hypothetical protein